MSLGVKTHGSVVRCRKKKGEIGLVWRQENKDELKGSEEN